jgi:hypothetical protein
VAVAHQSLAATSGPIGNSEVWVAGSVTNSAASIPDNIGVPRQGQNREWRFTSSSNMREFSCSSWNWCMGSAQLLDASCSCMPGEAEREVYDRMSRNVSELGDENRSVLLVETTMRLTKATHASEQVQFLENQDN